MFYRIERALKCDRFFDSRKWSSKTYWPIKQANELRFFCSCIWICGIWLEKNRIIITRVLFSIQFDDELVTCTRVAKNQRHKEPDACSSRYHCWNFRCMIGNKSIEFEMCWCCSSLMAWILREEKKVSKSLSFWRPLLGRTIVIMTLIHRNLSPDHEWVSLKNDVRLLISCN